MSSEWVLLSEQQLSADPRLSEAVERFKAPTGPAGSAAASWLHEKAREQMAFVATYVLVEDDEILGFYALGMGEVELRSDHRRKLGAAHPRQGAVVILWMARAEAASISADALLAHALGVARRAAERVGAAALALDPFDDETERFWRNRFGFRQL